jgi:hypothetical protein
VRFVVTTALGLIPVVGGLVGAAASAADSFAIDAIAERGSPKFFIEELKQLQSEPPASST